MSDAMTFEQKRLACESYCAYGSTSMLLCLGGLAALLPPPVYRLVISVLTTPVHSDISTGRTLLSPDAAYPLPLWLFALAGMLLAALAKPHRRLQPNREWWNAPWELLAGIPVFTLLSWHVFREGFPAAAEAGAISILWFIPLGCCAYVLWHQAFWLGIRAIAYLSWADTAQAVSRYYLRSIGIPKERVFLVAAEEKDYSVLIRGSFSDFEITRLRMGLLMALNYVTKLEVFGSRTAKHAARSDYDEYSAIARSRRNAALAKLERQRATAGKQEDLPLPWQERLFQHKYAGLLLVGLALVWAALVGFVVWLIGVLQPAKPNDGATPFLTTMHPKGRSINEYFRPATLT